MELIPYLLDLAGTFVFALSGAMAGVKRKLDVFGVLVLSFVAANAGGITRDILIGAVPPGAINDWRYLGVSLVAGIITFYFPLRLCSDGTRCCCLMLRDWRCSLSPAHIRL